MNSNHNTLIQDILDAEARNDHSRIGNLLLDNRIVDIDLFSSRNYIPNPSAIENLMDPYNMLRLENDLLKNEMSEIEKAVDKLIEATEATSKETNDKWGSNSSVQVEEEKIVSPIPSVPVSPTPSPAPVLEPV